METVPRILLKVDNAFPKTVFQKPYGGKAEISLQVSKVILGVKRKIGGSDCQYRGRNLWRHITDVSMEIQSFLA